MVRTQLSTLTANRLLWAAALFDAVLIFFLLQVLGPLVASGLQMVAPVFGTPRDLDPSFAFALTTLAGTFCYIVLLLCYWAITEIPLGGRTIGRICLMMELRQPDGSKPKMLRVTRRGVHKILSLGLSGLSWSGVDRHDRKSGLVWYSPLAAGSQSAMRSWSLRINSGRFQGTSHVMNRLPNFDRKRAIQIGRDPNWSDVVLDSEERISNQHAIIRLSRRGWEIADYGGGRGSSNKTYVNGKSISVGVWTQIGPKDKVRLANVEIVLGP